MSYNLYPLASPSGRAIPFDIIESVEHYGIAFSDTPLGAPINFSSVEASLHSLILWSTKDCVISFDSISDVDDFAAGSLFIPAFTIVSHTMPSNHISAIGEDEGVLHVNVVKLWDMLVTELQQETG